MDYWCCPYGLLGQRLEEVQAVLHTPEKARPLLPVFGSLPIGMDQLSCLRLGVGMKVVKERLGRTLVEASSEGRTVDLEEDRVGSRRRDSGMRDRMWLVFVCLKAIGDI